jgi:hypothetical protein
MGCFNVYKSFNVFYLAILMIFATAAKIILWIMYNICRYCNRPVNAELFVLVLWAVLTSTNH